jgi:hypothetical protein
MREMGEMTPSAPLVVICLHWHCLSLLINDMKRIYRKVFKSKPSLGLIHGPGPETSTSTLITDLMPSIPASDATASAQVTAGVSVSVQLRPSHFKYLLIVIEQTAHSLGVSTSVSALEISDLPPVRVPAGVHRILYNHLITAID